MPKKESDTLKRHRVCLSAENTDDVHRVLILQSGDVLHPYNDTMIDDKRELNLHSAKAEKT